MTRKFEITTSEWMPATPPDCDHTVANLSIRLYDTIVTEIVDRESKSTREFLRVSAGELAGWFARNYWRLRYEGSTGRDRLDWLVAHSMATVGGGYVWPKLVISSDGYMVRLNDRTYDRERFADVSFIGHRRPHYLTLDEFTQELHRFVDAVVERLRDHDPEAPLIGAWEDLISELSNSGVTLYRQIEAQLGYDIDQAPEEEVLEWDRVYDEMGISVASELLRAKIEVASAFELRDRAQKSDVTIAVDRLKKLATQTRERIDTNSRAWRSAKESAVRLRQTFGLDGPIQPEAMRDLFAIDSFQHLVNQDERAAGWDEGGRIRVVLRKNNHLGARLEIARFIGDYLAFESSLRPVLDTETWRQQFQRSFGQAFLAPIELIRERAPTGGQWTERAIEQVADDFMVSSWVVDDALRNNGDISANGVVDRDREYARADAE